MEIPHDIVTKAIAASRASPGNTGLREILFRVEGFSVIDFVNNSRPEEIEHAGQAIHGYASVGIFRNGAAEAESIAALAAVLATIIPYLKTGIQETKLEPILIFLMVNSLLQIPLAYLLMDEEMADPKLKALAKGIVSAYSNGIGDFVPTESDNGRTATLVNAYLEGVAEGNVSKTYQFVDRYQQTNRPPLNYLVSQLLAFLYQVDPLQAIRLLQATPEPMAYASYLFFFHRHILRSMAANPMVTENWLTFEIIRQLTFPKNHQSDDVDTPLFTAALRRIARTDFSFFKQTARHFRKEKAICAGVGAFLPETTDDEISQVLRECYPVNAQAYDHSSRNVLVNEFGEKASETQIGHLLTVIFQMWWNFMDEAVDSGRIHSKEMILTDYADLIPSYYIQVAPDADLQEFMLKTIRKLQWLDSRWSLSQLNQSATYCALHSVLFLLSFAYKEKEMHIASLQAEYVSLLRHPVQFSRFASDELKAKFPKAIENMEWHPRVDSPS